jgi:hypothetical protein
VRKLRFGIPEYLDGELTRRQASNRKCRWLKICRLEAEMRYQYATKKSLAGNRGVLMRRHSPL